MIVDFSVGITREEYDELMEGRTAPLTDAGCVRLRSAGMMHAMNGGQVPPHKTGWPD